MGAAVDEDRQPREELLLVRLEQVIRPANRRSQRLLAGVCVTPSLQQVEPLTQPLKELLRRENRAAGRRQLECERKVIETAAQLRHGGRLLERQVDLASPGEEELAAVTGCQRRHGVGVLGLKAETFAAGDEHVRPTRREEFTDARGDPR